MRYSFPVDLRHRIDAQLALGMFSNEDDVIREAIDTLEKRQRGLNQMRQMVQDAEAEIATGNVDRFDSERTKEAIRKRLEQSGSGSEQIR